MIRPATESDRSAIWSILEPVFREGETYAIDRDISRSDALTYWMDGHHCFVIEAGGVVQGTYYLKANHAGGGRHVCNCGYMVAAAGRGQGLARQMCEHSLTEAKRLGFQAMQFNFVVSTNTGAVHLWESLGFAVVGRLPEVFESPSQGNVDALVMFRKL
ncbi:GNAT family N-acetyltransferase [Altererythrobacter sp. RZ02]|uniref:GNAT family N-acetyltransferase n=1 Tax=Pontixanthobacter rizhaonensis TaxID=2730337 RepID=A0A848QJZ4_9SPHN|nr:N-acetyltransferase [Pontixanthobacter rizhaonensis]NMW31119.1 GNAT family N-acetyltransferase [Pontixanthobacter rizhaonensis]